MNVSASLNVFRLITNPALCLPHATIPTFNHLPIPLENAFVVGQKGQKHDIRALVLDKDNCFAKPKENVVWGEYEVSQFYILSSKNMSPANHAGHIDNVCCGTMNLRDPTTPRTVNLDGRYLLVPVPGLCPGGDCG